MCIRDSIYKVLIYFEKLYGVMNEAERRQLIEALISEIQIYPERQPNGQWLKSIKFKLPIIEEDMSISLDNEEQVETCLLYTSQLFPVLYGESSKIFHFAVAAYYEAIGRYVLFRCRYIPVSLLKMVYHKRTLYLNSWLILCLHSLVEYRAVSYTHLDVYKRQLNVL